MINPIFDKIVDSINDGAFFQQSMAALAIERLGEVDKERPVKIAIVGDKDFKDVRKIMTHLVSYLHYFEDREYYQVITGDRNGVEAIVRKACKENKVDLKVISHVDIGRFDIDRKEAEEETNDRILDLADAFLFITTGSDKTIVSMYAKARASGRLVTRRMVGVKK